MKNPVPQFKTTETGLAIPKNLQWNEWRVMFEAYSHMSKAAPWIVGDLMVYGIDHYGEDTAQLVAAILERTGYVNGTIRNLVYASRHCKPEHRNPNCSHSHHMAVAKLEPRKQVELLARAEIGRLTVRQLRNIVMGRKEEAKPSADEMDMPQDQNGFSSSVGTKKKISRGQLDDQFEQWWEKYSVGGMFNNSHKECARAAWNAETEFEIGL
jgi:hypothetical protein